MEKSTALLNKVEELKKFREQLMTNRIKARKKLEVLEKELEELNTQYISSDNTKDEDSKFEELKNKHIEIASVKQIGQYKLYDALNAKVEEANLDTLFAKAESEYRKYEEQINKEIKIKKDEQEEARKKYQQEISDLELKIREHKYNKARAGHTSLVTEIASLRRAEK